MDKVAGFFGIKAQPVRPETALAGKALDENRSAGQSEEANSLRILGIVARNEKD